jgi:hypothetical protein
LREVIRFTHPILRVENDRDHMTKILQTPPERFANVPGFPYRAHGRADFPGYAG